MALMALLGKEAFDQLPDVIKAEYKEITEGDLKDRFMLDVSPVEGHMLDNTDKLKRALQGERTSVSDLKASLKVFDGLDVEKAREALGKLDEIDNWDPEQKLDEHKKAYEQALHKKFEDESKGAIKKLTEDLELEGVRGKGMFALLSTALVDNSAIRALEQNGGSVELLLPHIKQISRLTETDGKFAVEIVGADGTVRLSPQQGNTGPMSVAELVEEMKGSDSFARAFEGSGASGSGATPPSGAQGGGTPGAMTITESEAMNPQKYQKAKEDAAKAGVPLEMIEG